MINGCAVNTEILMRQEKGAQDDNDLLPENYRGPSTSDAVTARPSLRMTRGQSRRSKVGGRITNNSNGHGQESPRSTNSKAKGRAAQLQSQKPRARRPRHTKNRSLGG
jgi:hypothetical protein